MIDGFELDASEEQAATDAQERLYHDERAALRRIANGLGGLGDAALLAGSLKHSDLARQFEEMK